MNLRALAVALLLSLSCGNEQPCTKCPPVGGVWFVQYLAPDFPCDGGTLRAPNDVVQITQEGAVLHSAIDGITVSGTLYDSYDLSMNGQAVGGGQTVNFRARYKGGTAADAGAETLVEGSLLRSAGSCREQRRFTGGRF